MWINKKMEVNMTIQVIGQSFDVGQSLTDHVKSVIEKKISKYNQ